MRGHPAGSTEENRGWLASHLSVQLPLALFALCTAGSPAAHPSVWVDVSRLTEETLTQHERRNLQGALQARLLEEGYTLGRPPEAVALRLLSTADGIRVHASAAQGLETHATTVPVERGEVLELELVHRALETLARVADAHPGDTGTRPHVSFEVRGASELAPAGELYLRSLPQVAAADVVVVPPSAFADWRLCVADSDYGHRALRARGEISCAEAWQNPVAYREAPLATLLREIEGQWALPPRRGSTRSHPRSTTGADAPLPPDLADAPTRPQSSPAVLWSFAGAAGIVTRRRSTKPPTAVDGLVRLEAIGTGARGFGVGMALATLPGVSSGDAFVDVIVGLGPRYHKRWAVGAIGLATTVGVDIGVLARATSSSPRLGSALSLELPLALTVFPFPRVGFDVLLLPGVNTPVEMRAGADRGLARLGLALGVRGQWGGS